MSSRQEFKETELGIYAQDWKLDILKNRADIIMGQSPSSKFYNNKGIGIPFMQGRKAFGDKYHTIDTWCTQPKRIAKQNSILMSVRAPVGDLNIANTELCIGRGLSSINMKNGNDEFLYYLLKNYKTRIISKETGTVFGSVNKLGIENLKLPFPSEKEQERIASILSSLDEKIELNNQINENFEQMAQAIFKHWFIDFEFPNENVEPYKSSGGEMVNSELGSIPKEWRVITFKEIIRISSGKRPKEKENEKNKKFNVPLIGASSIMGYVSEILYMKPILVIGRVGTHGIVQRINKKSWPSDNTLVIQSEYYEYIYQILKNIDYQSINRGSTQPLITQTDIKKYKIIFPKYKLLRDFEKRIGCLFQLINKNKEENKFLSGIRDKLLPKLMSGEIRVPINIKGGDE